MVCQKCKKKQASIHFTKIVDNEKVTLSICGDCAAEMGFHSPLDNVPFPLAEILSGMVQQELSHEKKEDMPDLECENCGLTFENFSRQGRFGCGSCYKAFRPRLDMIMRKLHGSSLHKGKPPVADQDQAHSIQEEGRLESELKKAIDAEDFERAADLRDKLKAMRESNLASKGDY
ncbi:MAG: UvrB/UvrC motif-containing protein [Candidatus Zixiibacteriota bacterium]|nr:MAG: UvrB/UvrC motif-containing protein [candidate division Zixibacteria bacterium]